MPRKKRIELDSTDISQEPAITSEGREKQLINAAYNLAEQRILDGTASDTMVTHFLKMGSQQALLDLKTKQLEMELVAAKTEALRSARRAEDTFTAAIEAMKKYGGDSLL